MSKLPSNEQLKVYLDYLDKEMTIMGILSTFCIIALGVVSEKLLFPSADSVFKFWKETPIYCELGLGGFLFSGLFFYRQRSLLAWYYGQLSLNQAIEDAEQVNSLLRDSDGWFNWRWYQAGFGALALAFVELGLATLGSFIPYIVRYERGFAILGFLVTMIATAINIYAYSKYPFEEHPLGALLRKIF